MDSEEVDTTIWWIQLARILWIAVMAWFYYYVVDQSISEAAVMATVRNAVVDRMYIDTTWNAMSETQEVQSVSDVVGTLDVMTKFCRDAHGIGDNQQDSWRCVLEPPTISEPNPAYVDLATARMLPTDLADSVEWESNMSESSGNLLKDPSPQRKKLAQRRVQQLQSICSTRFLRVHVGFGDDPLGAVSGDHAGEGDTAAFAKNVLSKVGINKLAESFDEYLGGEDAYFATQADVLDSKLRLQERLERVESKMDKLLTKMSSLSPRHKRRLVKRVKGKQVVDTEVEEDQDASIDSGTRKQGEDTGSSTYEYPTACFNRMSWVPQLRERWLQYDPHLRLYVHRDVFKKLVKDVYPKSSDEEFFAKTLAKYKFDNEGRITFSSFLKVATRHEEFMLLSLDSHGSLSAECRNHHWSLLSLCKPSLIDYRLRIIHMETRLDGTAVQRGSLLTRMTYRLLSEGVYEINVDFTTARSDFDSKVDLPFILFTVLFVCILLSEFLYSVCMLPLNIVRLLQFQVPPDASDHEAIILLWDQILLCCDARKVRSRFLSIFFILVENLCCILVVGSVVSSTVKASAPYKLPVSDPALLKKGPCFELYAKAEREWVDRYIRGEDVQRGVSLLSYYSACSVLSTRERISVMVQLAALRFDLDAHAVAVNLILFRLLAILDLWPALQWISLTAVVCVKKLMQFLVLYFTVVVCFAIGAQISFGCYYMQYRTLKDAFYALILFSSGHMDRAMDGVHPWIDGQSSALMVFLLVYTMLVAVVIMNVFTSIVLEAYDTAQNPQEAASESKAVFYDLMFTFVEFFRRRANGKPMKEEGVYRGSSLDGSADSGSDPSKEHFRLGSTSREADKMEGEGHGDASGASAPSPGPGPGPDPDVEPSAAEEPSVGGHGDASATS